MTFKCKICGGNLEIKENEKTIICEYCGNKQIIPELEIEQKNIKKSAIGTTDKKEQFDVFICYKETDENGNRTQDSTIAGRLYNNLTEQGYRVFCSEITLESKSEIQHDQYISEALNSSKVMIVVCTKKDYINETSVKNEWSRFLDLTKGYRKKILIPAYKEMNPYDLPKEFEHLQALDLGKIGVLVDLKNKIDVTLNKEMLQNEKKARKKAIKIVIIIISIIILSIISIAVTTKIIIPESQYKEANKLMEDENYDEAIAIFNKIEEYKDSKDKITICNNKKREKIKEELAKYIGTYDKTESNIDPIFGDEVFYGYILEITSAGSAGIEFDLTNYGHRVASISTTAKLDGDTYEFRFKDSWNNRGQGILKLYEDGISINLTITQYDEMANFSIGEGEIEFKFSDMIN